MSCHAHQLSSNMFATLWILPILLWKVQLSHRDAMQKNKKTKNKKKNSISMSLPSRRRALLQVIGYLPRWDAPNEWLFTCSVGNKKWYIGPDLRARRAQGRPSAQASGPQPVSNPGPILPQTLHFNPWTLIWCHRCNPSFMCLQIRPPHQYDFPVPFQYLIKFYHVLGWFNMRI